MIGIFGGSFNPPHIGHLILAEEALWGMSLRKVIFVPAGNPPHKEELLPPDVREKLLLLACIGNDRFEVNNYELKKKGHSYTIDTLEFFTTALKEEFVFLMGADSFAEIKTWKSWQEILSDYKIAVWRRRDVETSGIVEEEFLKNVEFMENSFIDISSSDIRKRIKTSRPYRYLLPEKVFSYIDAMELYR